MFRHVIFQVSTDVAVFRSLVMVTWMRVPLVGAREDPWEKSKLGEVGCLLLAVPRVQQERATLVVRLCGLPQCSLHVHIYMRVIPNKR